MKTPGMTAMEGRDELPINGPCRTDLKAITPYDEAPEKIRKAVKAVKALGINVRPGTTGVVMGQYASMWCEDPGEQGVSPIGAFLIGKSTEEEPDTIAAGEELLVSIHWVSGFDDGFAMDPQHPFETVPMYMDGFEEGARLRFELGIRR